MIWRLSDKGDPPAVRLADRHYTRQTPGSPQFVAPGRCMVLLAPGALAVWVTRWPDYAQHDWAGAWECPLFRNEGAGLSSALIREAVAATRHRFGTPPALGMVTFVDPAKVRRKRDPGRCFRRAGFEPDGWTQKGLLALVLHPDRMPAPAAPAGEQQQLEVPA